MTKNITGQRMRSFLCKGLMLGMAVMVLGATSISFEKPAIAQSKQNVNLNSYKVRKETKITMQEAKEIVAGYFNTTVDEIDFKKAELKWVKNMDHISSKPFTFKKDLAIGTPYYAIECSYDVSEYDIAIHGESGKIVKLILKKKDIF
jgi:uncharacterized membrane protein YkoI